MAQKIKFTRNELKAQRVALARYTRFLPTLELKKMQLEVERRKILRAIGELQEERQRFREEIARWQRLFSEAWPKTVPEMVHVAEVVTGETNIAGIYLPVFQEIRFAVDDYDRFLAPLWFEQGIAAVKRMIELRQRLQILQSQEQVISNELRKTTQRINLFKERLIPECKENIRQIRIYLGDMQAAAVGRAKIAKQKMQR